MSKKNEAKEKKRGVGTAAVEAIKAGMDNDEALAAVQKEFPDAKTSKASVNWYRNKLRSDGVKGVKTARELKAAKVKAEKTAAKTAEKDPLA